MPKWNFASMGRAGSDRQDQDSAWPAARAIARRTGRSEAGILSFMGAAFLMITLINFARAVSTVITAGEPDVSRRTTIPPMLSNGLEGVSRELGCYPWLTAQRADRRPAEGKAEL